MDEKNLTAVIQNQQNHEREIGGIIEAIEGFKSASDQQGKDLRDSLRIQGESFNAALDKQNRTIEKIAERINAPKSVNYVGIGALIVALLGSAGAYIQTRLAPTEAEVASLREGRIDSLRREGRAEATDEFLKEYSKEDRQNISELQVRVSLLEGKSKLTSNKK